MNMNIKMNNRIEPSKVRQSTVNKVIATAYDIHSQEGKKQYSIEKEKRKAHKELMAEHQRRKNMKARAKTG